MLRAALPRRRCRHHRRQFPDRRDRLLDHRHQRGQRRPDADPAEGAHRHRLASRRSCRRWRTRRPILRVLARSATGQEFSAYTTFSTGPRRRGRPGRARANITSCCSTTAARAMLGAEFQDMLRCIRCGACMNHCPVYDAVGGHAYGWVYPGPMGAVLTPALIGIEQAARSAQRLDLLRPLRERLPDAHSAAEADAPLARARVRQGPDAADRARTALGAVGLPRHAAPALSLVPGGRDAARSAWPGRRRGRFRSICRWPAAGPGIATCRRPQGAPSSSMWAAPEGAR